MSVKFRKLQNKLVGSATYGKWYGRAVVSEVVDTDQLASNIEKRCTVTRPDILAVLAALTEDLKSNLQQGNRVVIDGFGSFKTAISSYPADTAKEYTASNVKKLRIVFQPVTVADAQRRRSIQVLEGCKVEEMAEYVSPTDGEGESTSTDTGSGSAGQGGSQTGQGTGSGGSSAGTGGGGSSAGTGGGGSSAGTGGGSSDAAADE